MVHAMNMPNDPKTEKRFEFGKNWKSFQSTLSEKRIRDARESLLQFLDMEDLQNKSFIDIGSGSGLFSLAAHQFGANVHSFDYDQQSVECTRILKKKSSRVIGVGLSSRDRS
jgi:2-polyprenyl-6-hydroxyphenyl methylase/3-demethylubiquinone-9 3-methyltransferase